MERLTQYFDGEALFYKCRRGCLTCDRAPCEDVARMVDRLAAYEDTGLTPEEVKALIPPPDDPLTLEELRQMDGEPVWIEWGGHPQAGWALVRVWSKANDVIYLTYHNGDTDLLGFVLNNGGKIYRRRPEGR